jgi:hypothetical protein
MSEFFAIVSLALTGLLDITNQGIGILIAWTILDVPLLFILVVFDFMKTLLEELGIIKEIQEDYQEATFDYEAYSKFLLKRQAYKSKRPKLTLKEANEVRAMFNQAPVSSMDEIDNE